MIELPLTRGFVAIIDDADGPLVAHLKWCAMKGRNTWYAVRSVWQPDKRRYRVDMLHRVLMNAARGVIVDHRDRDGLNNRRHNLRVASRSQNAANGPSHRGSTSDYRGVAFDAATGRWDARVSAGGCMHFLGRFDSELEAAHAYDAKAVELFGEFARPNFGGHQ